MVGVVLWQHPLLGFALVQCDVSLVLCSIELGECHVGDRLLGDSNRLILQPVWNITRGLWCFAQVEATDMTEDEANYLLGFMPGLLS